MRNNAYDHEFEFNCNLNQFNYTLFASNYGQVMKLCGDPGYRFADNGSVEISMDFTLEYNPKLFSSVEFDMFRTLPKWYHPDSSSVSIRFPYTYYYNNNSHQQLQNNQNYELKSGWFNLSKHFDGPSNYNSSDLSLWFNANYHGNSSRNRDWGANAKQWTLFKFTFNVDDYLNQTASGWTSMDAVRNWDDINFDVSKSLSEFVALYPTVLLLNGMYIIISFVASYINSKPTKEEVETDRQLSELNEKVNVLIQDRSEDRKQINSLENQLSTLRDQISELNDEE